MDADFGDLFIDHLAISNVKRVVSTKHACIHSLNAFC